jgi:type VI secretion system secreted protein VgrG
MSKKPLQADRAAEFTSKLGKDVLVLTDFSGSEGLGELFEYRVDALSDQKNIDFDGAIGKGCQVELKTDDGKTRIFHGVMTEARWVGSREGYNRYHVVLRPWFWLLGHKADCRIFLNKTVKDIIQDVLGNAPLNDFEFRTTGSYDQIEYCVQYRESDLAFVCRLMEHYGIYYFFEHSDGTHKMVLADSPSSHQDIADLSKLTFNPFSSTRQDDKQTLRDWASERRFRTGKFHFNDYDYEEPNKDLKAPKEAAENYDHSKLEVYDYHYKYDDKGKGEDRAQFRLDAEQALDHRRSGSGDAASLYPGGLVTLEKHPTDDENTTYLVVRASHHFASQQYRSTASPTGQAYSGAYIFQPKDRPFRSLPLTPKPRIYGIHTAKVVKGDGGGEEISTDEYGRIWVQFHWDREPQTSCPVRVAQVWAGNNWGAIFIPRVGMEVVVDFLEGDPDRPLVTGCVYNGVNKPPYPLPDNKTKAGWKSNSSEGGGGFNEFAFEDKAGSEDIIMHAEKDHDVVIKDTQTVTIGEAFTSGKGAASRNWTLKQGDDYLDVQQGNLGIDVDMGNYKLDVKMGNISVKADLGMIEVEAMQSITLKVGQNSIKIDQTGVTIDGLMLEFKGQVTAELKSPMTTVNGDAMLTLKGGVTMIN